MCVQGHADKGLIHTARQKDLQSNNPRATSRSLLYVHERDGANQSINFKRVYVT